jgi:peptidyl-prolyl cis-trans isomerase SurA
LKIKHPKNFFNRHREYLPTRFFSFSEMKPITFPLIIFLLVLLAGPRLFAQSPNRIVALVNNEIITLHELEKAFNQLNPTLLEKGSRQEIQKQLLFQLIDQKLIDLQIKRLGIQIPAEEVDKAISRIMEEQGLTGTGELARALEKEGLSEADFRNKVKDQILRYRLVSREIGSKIIIAEERIKEYFEKNKGQFQKQEGIHLALIFLKADGGTPPEERMNQKKKMEEIRERLLKGEPFAELARKYSQDPSASAGGDLGVLSPNDLDPSLRQALTSLKTGDISQVLQTPGGWNILKVVEVIGAKEVALNEVRDRVFEKLFQEEVDLRFTEWLQKVKDRSYIQILL